MYQTSNMILIYRVGNRKGCIFIYDRVYFKKKNARTFQLLLLPGHLGDYRFYYTGCLINKETRHFKFLNENLPVLCHF